MPHPPFQLIAPPHTPLRNDGALHLEAVEKQAAHLALAGVDGVFVAGSTGEGQFLTVRERIALTEHWAAAGERHGLRVIVHVGHNCQADAQHLAEHASSTGVLRDRSTQLLLPEANERRRTSRILQADRRCRARDAVLLLSHPGVDGRRGEHWPGSSNWLTAVCPAWPA